MIKNLIITKEQYDHLTEMRAYHGTSSHFDEFSLDYYHSGEGSNVYGKGIYLTGCKDVADYYAREVGRAYGKQDNLQYKFDVNKHGENKFKIQNILWDLADLMSEQNLSLEEAQRQLRMMYWEEGDESGIWCLDNVIDWNLVIPRGKDKLIYVVDIPSIEENKYWYFKNPITLQDKEELASSYYNLLVNSLKRLNKYDKDRLANAESSYNKFLSSDMKNSKDIMLFLGENGLDAEEWFSEILKNLGYIGVIVPIGYTHGGHYRGNNFVIFDPKNVRIKKKTISTNGNFDE